MWPETALRRPSLDFRPPNGFWSLWDIMRIYAAKYIFLGEIITDMRLHFSLDVDAERDATFREDLNRILEVCRQLNLSTSKILVESRKKELPKTESEFELLIDVVKAEIHSRLFLFVSEDRAKYYEKKDLVSQKVETAFPNVFLELRDASNCLAVGQYTASVFHAMRAVELGLRAIATSLDVAFDFPIELADWANVVDKLEAKIRAMKELSKSAEKDARLHFYSSAAMQFRYFKDTWRVRVSHARENYDEKQAITALEHTISFFETLSAPPTVVSIVEPRLS